MRRCGQRVLLLRRRIVRRPRKPEWHVEVNRGAVAAVDTDRGGDRGSPVTALRAVAVNGSITFWNSTIGPGQPWVMTSGKASARGERWWMTWIPRPSISVVNW